MDLNKVKVSTHYVKTEKTQREKEFYQSAGWRRVRKVILERDDYLCQNCIKEGKITTECPTLGGSALHVHHIIPIREDWSKRYDASNLITLCNACHAKQHPEKLEKLGWNAKKEPEKPLTEKEKRLKNVKKWTTAELVKAINGEIDGI